MKKVIYHFTYIGQFFDSMSAIVQMGNRHFEFYMNVCDKTHMYQDSDDTNFQSSQRRLGRIPATPLSDSLVATEVAVSIWMEGQWKYVIRDMKINVASNITQDTLFATVFPQLAEMVIEIVDGIDHRDK